MTATTGAGVPDADDAPAARSTLDDVAALAGVSAKTASRALNGHPGVSASTREKVVASARMLRFRPNGLARELRTGAVSSGVGLVIADLANPFYSQVAAGAERELRSRGLELFVASTNEQPDAEREVVRTMLDRRVRALLIVPASNDHSYLQFEQSLGTPIVFLDRPAHGLVTDVVLSDNRSAARDAVSALIDAGHERIAIIGDEQSAWTARERLDGARESLSSRGRTTSNALIGIDAHTAEESRVRVLDMLARDTPPTAIFALNNLITLGVLMALRDSGAAATVIGFDDSGVADIVGVSVIALDPIDMGRRAAIRALARLDGDAGEAQELILPTRLVVRTPLDEPIRIAPSAARQFTE